MQDALLRDSEKLLSQDGLACKVSIAQLASWLAQQGDERRRCAQQAQRAQRGAMPATIGSVDTAWEPKLADIHTGLPDAG